MMSMAECDTLLQNPDIEQLLSAPSISYSGAGIKTDAGWNDMLKRIKKSNRGSTINTGNIGQI